ncbi:acyltransferase [Akkermansiaceae bacterium]|nr:acyltransferase [Akkermansiaceae bacterium]
MKLWRKTKTLFMTPFWKWHVIALKPLTRPLSPGLWVANVWFQRVLGINFDCDSMVHFTSRVVSPGQLELGDGPEPRLSLAASGDCYLQAGNGILIGGETIFAPGVKIISANHDMSQGACGWMPVDPIRIGERCWLGANSVILPEVILGDDCVVGAGAVVTKSFPAGSTIAGVPARLIRRTERVQVENSDDL